MEEVRIPLLTHRTSDSNGVSYKASVAVSKNGQTDYRVEIHESEPSSLQLDREPSVEGTTSPAIESSSSSEAPHNEKSVSSFSVANEHFQSVLCCLGEQPCIGPHPSVDPFRNSTPKVNNLYGCLKTVLCIPLLVARVLLLLFFMCIGFISTNSALAGWNQKIAAMPRWRRNVMGVTRFCARGILFSFGYHWIQRIGRPAPREIAPVIVSNHVSYVDPIFYFYELFPSFVSSSSHNDIFLVGTIIKAMQVILVDRLSPDSRKDAATEIKRRASCNDFPQVLLFPEGTTTNGRAVISFKLGAFIHGFPVQPVIVRYPYVHHDPSWGDISLWKLFLRMLTQFHNFMEVEYLPVMYSSEAESHDPVDFAEEVRYAMATVLNVPETEHTHGDLMLVSRAKELKLTPATSAMVEMGRVAKVFHLGTFEVKAYLDHFVEMGPNHRGFVTKMMFLEKLDLPDCEFSNNIFSLFDKLKRGYFNFREFVAVMGFISKNIAFDALLKKSFEACDADKDGCLSQSEVEKCLRTIFSQASNGWIEKVHVRLGSLGSQLVTYENFKISLSKYPDLFFIISTGAFMLHREKINLAFGLPVPSESSMYTGSSRDNFCRL